MSIRIECHDHADAALIVTALAVMANRLEHDNPTGHDRCQQLAKTIADELDTLTNRKGTPSR